jgi:NhaA family Na+:H+ antiporter
MKSSSAAFANRALRALRANVHFILGEPAAGVTLLAATAVAIVWANTSHSTYEGFWRIPLTVGIPPLALSKPLLLWINDGLMAVFFFVVGLEIKREIVRGQLASTRQAAFPIAAAFGGMLIPAGIYASVNARGAGAAGWGIPMATDIAFALGVLALLSNRVVPSLRLFLTAVAIADDLGAIAVIAIFYTADLKFAAFVVGAVIVAALAVMNRIGVQRRLPYVLLGLALWIAVLKSGVHATVAGVILAFAVPATPDGRGSGLASSLLDRFEHSLTMWVRFAIMPLFALANAGVEVSGEFASKLADPIAAGIIFGLFFGKQLGVMAACWSLVHWRVAPLPSGVTWRQLYGVAILCGIGFTMSLFIATLAFDSDSYLESAKVGVLVASLLSGVVGYAVLASSRRPPN